ncbi:MAG: patatin-like phospholipase family protein, partial [Flavobacteriales bacterium]
ALMDYEMLKLLGTTSASVNNNFDSLFVPFRCVASDIAKKQSIIFSKGYLNEAVRASMTYPFYYKSIMIDSVLLFDGGLYNNFPSDVMYTDFDADFIIGSNVSFNAELPHEDDLIGQFTNMLVSYSDFTLPCEESFMIAPSVSISGFNFNNAKKAIDEGYDATVKIIDSLKLKIVSRIDYSELKAKRAKFRENITAISVSSVTSKTESENLHYSTRTIMKDKKQIVLNERQLERRYFRLRSSSQIDFIFPRLQLKDDSTYNLDLTISKAKEIKVEFGGHLSSRPVNTGYIGLSYQTAGKYFTKTKVESYFGKFYGSAKAKFTFELPTVYPFSASVYFTQNRWDYFRSFATFFEDVKPSFLVQNEMYLGVSLKNPIGNTITSKVDGRWFELEDTYYQTDNFTNKDTADLTRFYGGSASWTLTQNTLNRRQFANSGHFVEVKTRLNFGTEHTVPGSTALNKEMYKPHSWFNLNIDYQSFIVDQSMFHLGIHGQFVYNTQPLFANYTATLLSMTEFSLIPDSKTYFLPEYRSPQYAAAGLNLIFTIMKKIDIRFDTYLYQPLIQINELPDGSQEFSELFQGRSIMASSSIIYNSYIGPLRFTLNYFPQQTNPLALQLSLGYVIFNDRAIR